MIPVAVRSKAWVYGRSLVGIAGSNTAGGMDICLLRMLCVVHVEVSLPSVVCLSAVVKPRQWEGTDPPRIVEPGVGWGIDVT
jgi:hypothetical protein